MASQPQSTAGTTLPIISKPAAIQVICLGSGGGPSEDNVSGFLVRSAAAGWVRGSLLAFDAGSHLAAITRILERDLPAVAQGPAAPLQAQPRPGSSAPSSPLPSQQLPTLEPILLESGPFANLPLPHASARANSLHIVRSHVAAYLITHPHLDHLSGFAINTAAFHATSRPKTLAALPFTVEAIKRHIFNDVIWPNLTDEDGGVGFVTFQRLKEGGDVMVGEGEGRGYIEVCEGLGAKGFRVSHGRCMGPGPASTESHRGSISNMSDGPNGFSTTPRGNSEARNHSLSHLHLPSTPGSYYSLNHHATSHPIQEHNASTVDSSAFFIRDIATSREILMFGDVEPDSISLSPRLARVWAEAAPKIASGSLTGIFIECSYPDSQIDALLFGHLAPRHLVAELQVLADMVREERANRASDRAFKKRKRGLNGSVHLTDGDDLLEQKRSRSLAGRTLDYPQRRSSVPEDIFGNTVTSAPLPSLPSDDATASGHSKRKSTPAADEVHTAAASLAANHEPPLARLRVIVMHVKDTMQDGPHVSELILQQLDEHARGLAARGLALGCQFEAAQSGADYWF